MRLRHHDGAYDFDQTVMERLTGKGSSIRAFMAGVQAEFGYQLDYDALCQMPLYELAERLCLAFGITTDADAYTLALLEQMQTFTQKGLPGIHSFLMHWDNEGADKSITTSPDLNAVRIMTIHKAKGLEFPVVIMAFADWQVHGTDEKATKAWERVKPGLPELDGLPLVRISRSKALAGSAYNEENAHMTAADIIDSP